MNVSNFLDVSFPVFHVVLKFVGDSACAVTSEFASDCVIWRKYSDVDGAGASWSVFAFSLWLVRADAYEAAESADRCTSPFFLVEMGMLRSIAFSSGLVLALDSISDGSV